MDTTERGDRLKVAHRFLIAIILLAGLVWKAVPTAAAQDTGLLVISVPETDAFPSMVIHMDAYDAAGRFLDQLSKEDIQVIEDGQVLHPTMLEKVPHGLQTIIALNTSPTFANKREGISAYEQVQQALINWAKQQPATTLDDFSFSTPTGLYLIRANAPQQMVKAFTEYQPDLQKLQPSLGSLAEALDLATDPLEDPLMKRAILYITSPLPPAMNANIEDLALRARETGVRVHVWVIAPPGKAGSEANPLQKLSDLTGGQYQELAPSVPLPELEPLFRPLRQSYRVTYPSAIKKSGMHKLSIKVNKAITSLDSNERSFSIDVQPPNPIFLSPPASVQRTWTKANPNAAEALSPDTISLQILIEFPDKHKRDMKATRLFVNDNMVEENTSEPFDHFTWSIADLTTPGKHMLRVEAVDVLNLKGTSIEVPVEVLVDQPAQTNISDHISARGMIAVGAMVAAGAALALVLALNNNQRSARRSRQLAEKRLMKDPVTQPVKIKQESSRPKKEKSTPARSAHGWHGINLPRSSATTAPARLIVLDETEQPITGGVVPLTRQEITFGSDPQRATQVLDSPTVDELHARLYREQDGNFYLADNNTIAGTWVNYTPISSGGTRLEHGDLIHIGKVMFRFEITEPVRVPIVEVEKIDLEQ